MTVAHVSSNLKEAESDSLPFVTFLQRPTVIRHYAVVLSPLTYTLQLLCGFLLCESFSVHNKRFSVIIFHRVERLFLFYKICIEDVTFFFGFFFKSSTGGVVSTTKNGKTTATEQD